MDVWVGKPTNLTDDEITATAVLICSGGALPAEIKTLKGRLRRSSILAIYREEDQVLAVASLKKPNPNYRIGVFEKASVSLGRLQSAPELGYVTVDEKMRSKGLAGKLVSVLLDNLEEPCYATTNNNSMKRILERAGFSEKGQAWKGQRGSLSLWTTER